MSENVTRDLASITSEEDFADRAYALTESWRSNGADAAAIGPVLSFIESHPDWDLGSPGELVHFVEQFTGPAYEEKLLTSLRRQPTTHTLWMLNRLINGEADAKRRKALVQVMVDIASAPDTSSVVVNEAREFIDFQTEPH